MDLGLKGSVVFVAGSSRGIGFAIANSFLKEGASVILTGRGLKPLNKARDQLTEIFGRDRVAAFHGDLADANIVSKIWNRALKRFGSINIVIANVGSGTAKSGFNLTPEDWREVFSLNLDASMHLAAHALSYLTAQQQGSLIFISSIAGLESLGAPMTYAAAKAALGSAAKSLSRLAGPQGVRVNVVAPGNILFPGGTWEKKLKDREQFFKNYIETEVPLQRFGSPDEIADAVIFLASKRAAFITGSCIVVDGGQTRAFF